MTFPRSLPYQSVVIFTYPNGDEDIYGMFDTSEEIEDYIEMGLAESPEGTTARSNLLMPK